MGQKTKSYGWKMKYFGWKMKYMGWKMELKSACEVRTSGIKNIFEGYGIENKFFGTKNGSLQD